MSQKNQLIVIFVSTLHVWKWTIIDAKRKDGMLIHDLLNPVYLMKRTKKSMKKKIKDHYSLPIGIIPIWLLEAESGKGFWENFIPDEKFRNYILTKTREPSQWKRGELFYEENL